MDKYPTKMITKMEKTHYVSFIINSNTIHMSCYDGSLLILLIQSVLDTLTLYKYVILIILENIL